MENLLPEEKILREKAIDLETRRRLVRIISTTGFITTLIFGIYVGKTDMFRVNGPFHRFIESIGPLGMLVFTLFMAFQTVVPIIPGGFANVIGVLTYGHILGISLNIIGMMMGSCINFLLGRKFGEPLIKSFISDEKYDKYIGKMNEGKGFERLLIVGFLAPLFPDDIFCMIAGLCNMTFKRFFLITLLCRPISLAVFTTASTSILKFAFSLIFK